jgi:hypothetical protein
MMVNMIVESVVIIGPKGEQETSSMMAEGGEGQRTIRFTNQTRNGDANVTGGGMVLERIDAMRPMTAEIGTGGGDSVIPRVLQRCERSRRTTTY